MQVDCRSNLSDPDEESPIIKLQEEKNNWLFLSLFYKVSPNIYTKGFFWDISFFNAFILIDRTKFAICVIASVNHLCVYSIFPC